MERQLKFRAWDKEDNHLHYGGFSLHATGKLEKTSFISGDEIFIMQFTGLLDKNGKEIYEGDIIEQEVHPYPFKYKVGWRDIECCFYAECIDSDEWFMLYDFDFTVIGNIHQQPELLDPDNG